jgi:hypothetical protein
MPIDDDLFRHLHGDFTDNLDEELELELDDGRLYGDSDDPDGRDELPYRELVNPAISLPERTRHEDYIRRPVPREMHVPGIY